MLRDVSESAVELWYFVCVLADLAGRAVCPVPCTFEVMDARTC